MEVASVARLPSPDPDPIRKRNRSPSEAGPSKRFRGRDAFDDEDDRRRDGVRKPVRSPSPDRKNGASPSRKNGAIREQPPEDGDPRFKMLQNALSANRKTIDDSKTRAGGAYIPPARLRAMQAAITDKTSPEYQRMAWEALKKSIQGMINKCNVSNIKLIVPELFAENLIRGRGLFCRSIMKAQSASLPFTPIYAAIAAIVNTKLPQIGDLLARRLVVSFRKAFKRNDKVVAVSSSTFIAHLVNQQVVHETTIGQILLLLLHKPTDDSVEIAVSITREVGHFLEEFSPAMSNIVYEQFRNILHEAGLEKRTQYAIEVLFQLRKDKYKDNPSIREELDLVDEEDQFTHRVSLDDDISVEDGLNIFKVDPNYEANEESYRKLKAEILGEAEGSEEEDGYTDDSSEDEEDKEERALEIKDQTNADLVNLRRQIYLTIKSSGGFEECCHKLMRINLPMGMEKELTSMIVECASQERTYEKFYGMTGERFCKLNRMWCDLFENNFAEYYETIHRFETNRLRIIAQFFGHLLATDAIGWHVLMCIKMNEEDTTSSSRIFVKILFEELIQAMGQKAVVERLREPMLQEALTGIFPKDDQKNTRFSINFFTAIGMGILTEDMREWLKNAPKPAPLTAPESESDSESVSSYSSYSSRSRSRSRTPPRRRLASVSVSRSRSPAPRRRRSPSDSVSESRSPAPRRRRYSSSRSRSLPPRRRGRSPSDSVSRSPPRRRHYSTSPSRSPSSAPRRRRQSSTPPRQRRPSPSPAPRNRRPSPSPPPRRRMSSTAPARRRLADPKAPSPPRRRRQNSSSASRSPSPPHRGRRYSPSPSKSASPPRRRRRNSGFPSRSPSAPRRRRYS